jgi:hypothetical protein
MQGKGKKNKKQKKKKEQNYITFPVHFRILGNKFGIFSSRTTAT